MWPLNECVLSSTISLGFSSSRRAEEPANFLAAPAPDFFFQAALAPGFFTQAAPAPAPQPW